MWVTSTARTGTSSRRKPGRRATISVATISGEQDGTLYRRSPDSLVVELAADMLEHVSTDELVTRILKQPIGYGDGYNSCRVQTEQLRSCSTRMTRSSNLSWGRKP